MIDQVKLQSWIKLNDQFYLDPDGLLGKGCFGQVFRGYSTKRNCMVAIKTMQGQGYEREVQTLVALSSLIHPNIMGFFGFQKRNDTVYLFVQFCPNGTLTDLIKQGIQQEKVLVLFRQIIEGMCYMNAKGKMHRDLKPDNILIGMDKDIKISDFGLARQTTGIFVTGQMGTPLYAGPQVYLNKYDEAYSERCDVWGAGMILYQMLTGQLLFKGVKTFQDLRKQWHRYQIGQGRVQFQKKYHPNWEYFVNYLLTYDPKKRPTFHEVLQKLKKMYEKMLLQIKSKTQHQINQKTKIGQLQLLLIYFQEKYAILLKIYENNRIQTSNLKSQLRYLISFLALSHYLCKVKKLIRLIKYKRVKIDQDDDTDLIQQQNQQYDLVLDRYKNIFEHKQKYYNDHLQKQILPKLAQISNKKQESIYKDLKYIWELFNDVNEGTFDVEQTYNEALKQLLKIDIQKHQPGYYSNLSIQQLKSILIVFQGALIQQNFQNKKFIKRTYIKDALSQIQTGSKNQLQIKLKQLRKKL